MPIIMQPNYHMEDTQLSGRLSEELALVYYSLHVHTKGL